jgi:hypothetical protein
MKQAITPGPASAGSGTSGPTVKIQVSAEHWQFFAFVFAAFVTLAFTVLDSLSSHLSAAWVVGVKVMAFVFLAWVTLWFWPIKKMLIRLLPTITTEDATITMEDAMITPRA